MFIKYTKYLRLYWHRIILTKAHNIPKQQMLCITHLRIVHVKKRYYYMLIVIRSIIDWCHRQWLVWIRSKKLSFTVFHYAMLGQEKCNVWKSLHTTSINCATQYKLLRITYVDGSTEKTYASLTFICFIIWALGPGPKA